MAIGTQDTTINMRDRRPADPRAQAAREVPAARRQVQGRHLRHPVEELHHAARRSPTRWWPASSTSASMADFPGSFNGAALREGRASSSLFITVLSGSMQGQRQRHRRAVGFAGAVARRAEGQDDLGALRVDRARHAAARGQGARLGPEQGRQHHHPGARGRRPRAAGQQDRGACRLRAVRRAVPAGAASPARSTTARRPMRPTFHGALVDADYAEKYPEIVVAYPARGARSRPAVRRRSRRSTAS